LLSRVEEVGERDIQEAKKKPISREGKRSERV